MSELTPVTREEMYLDEIADALENGGGGGGAAVYNATITIQKNGTKVDDFTANQRTDKTINITVPTTAADVSALPDTTKYAAALSLTINSSTFVMTGQLKDQNGDNLGTAQTIDLPLESVVVGGSYNSQTKKVVLTLQNGNTIEFSVADLVSGLQTELSASNKLNPAYINYDSTHAAVSDTEKSTWNGKQNAIDSSHKLSADLVDDTSTTNKFATAAELEQIETNKNNISTIYNANGRKNIIPNKGSLIKDDMTYAWTADGTIQISGTKTAGTGNYVEPLGLTAFNKLGLSTGDTIVLSSNGTNSYISVIFWSSGSSYSSSYDITNGSREVLIPSNYTHMMIRIGVKSAETSASETISAMICDKKLWDISSEFAPYAPTNAELYAMIQALQS